MLTKNTLLLVLTALISFTRCQSDATSKADKIPTNIDYQKLATTYCECAQPSVILNDKMKALVDAGKEKAYTALIPEVQQAFDIAVDCCTKAKAAQTSAALDKQKIGTSLKNQCSEMPDRLTLSLLGKIK